MEEQPPKPFTLAPAELAALFPVRAPTGPDTFPLALAGPTPESKEPADAPPTADALVSALEPLSPNLAGMVKLVRACSNLKLAHAHTLAILGAVTSLAFVAAATLAFKVNDGTFPYRSVAASVAGVSAFWVAAMLIQVANWLALRSFLPPTADLLAGCLTGARNWALATETGSTLLEHADGDQACPCRTCCSGLVEWMFWERVVRIVPFHMLCAFYFLTTAWTPVVHFGTAFWGSWWGVLVGTVALLADVLINASSVIARFALASPAETSLATRLYLRASSRALHGFLDRSRGRLLAGTGAPDGSPEPPSGAGSPEIYVALHLSYRSRWTLSRRPAFGSSPWTTLAVLAFPAVGLVGLAANLATGGCVCLWTVVLYLMVIYGVVVDLAALPSVNSQIEALTLLYAEARLSLRAMLAESAALPRTPTRLAVEDELRAHSALLATISDAGGLRATFVGVPITWGLAKTLGVTLITLGVALWSVLRGVGVFFTIDSVCPPPA